MAEVVLTCLLTAEPDPQRGLRWEADSSVLAVLRESVARHERHLVVVHDGLADRDGGLTTFTRVPPGGNPYWTRWVHYRDWLARHPEVRWAWCVDGTDTEMLHDPFGHMQAGRLYVGSERETLGSPGGGAWLARGATPAVCDWLAAHPDLPILNMGLLGGDRATLLECCEALAARAGESDWEIGAFQQVAREQFADRLVTGPLVHSVFKADDRGASAWWRHK